MALKELSGVHNEGAGSDGTDGEEEPSYARDGSRIPPVEERQAALGEVSSLMVFSAITPDARISHVGSAALPGQNLMPGNFVGGGAAGQGPGRHPGHH